MSHIIQYDMGLRLWVLSGPTGQILQTYFSRAAALKDKTVRRIIEGGGDLRIRNADGTYAPADAVAERETPPVAAIGPRSIEPGAALTFA